MVIGTGIVTRPGGLAFALDQAASCLRHEVLPLDQLNEVLIAYEAYREVVLTYYLSSFWPKGTLQTRDMEQDKAIKAFSALEMSFRQLQKESALNTDDVAHFLTLSAFFDSASINESLLRGRSIPLR